MALSDALRAVEGAQQLHDWFGYWPTFHDAEVICLHLNRKSPSILKVHTWKMTSEVDGTGRYLLAKDVVVDFVIDVSTADDALELYGFSHQNVIFGLAINKDDSKYKLDIDPKKVFGPRWEHETEKQGWPWSSADVQERFLSMLAKTEENWVRALILESQDCWSTAGEGSDGKPDHHRRTASQRSGSSQSCRSRHCESLVAAFAAEISVTFSV